MQSFHELKQSTMRRIYAIWFVRTVVSPASLKAAIALALLWRMKEFVSVRQVIANAPSLLNPAGNLVFFESAFFNTEFAVQGTLLALLFVGTWFVRDLLRGYALLVFRGI